MKKAGNVLIKNTFYLYLLNFAKMILPLVTLPYLTRVLSTECYGAVTYVKACMSYMQLFIDFGFVFSATKEIVSSIDDNNFTKAGRIVGDTIAAKGILSVVSGLILLMMTLFIPILRQNILFTWIYFISIVLTIFLTDFLFRGLSKMEMVTLPYVIAKLISTIFTVIFVKTDTSIILLPVFETIGTFIAIIVVAYISRHIGIKLSFSGIKTYIKKIKESFVYFISNFATTAFGVLNTLFIGVFLDSSSVAYWGLCLQLVSAIQNMYTPIANGIYPQMLQHKNIKIINNVLAIFMPIITIGCIFSLLCSDWIICLIGGEQYAPAVDVFRLLVPVLFIGFPAIIYGWPVLGAIDKEKETSFSTVIAALVQVLFLILLGFTKTLTLKSLAVCRCISECVLLAIRYYFYKKYRNLFLNEKR